MRAVDQVERVAVGAGEKLHIIDDHVAATVRDEAEMAALQDGEILERDAIAEPQRNRLVALAARRTVGRGQVVVAVDLSGPDDPDVVQLVGPD